MPRLLATALACLALAAGAALAGCGSDAKKDTSSTQAAPPAATAAKPGLQVKVTMKNIKFVPEATTAKVGQKIVWDNTDSPPHTVTASSGAKFDSGDIAPGATFDYTPTKTGTIAYFCKIHAGQKGTITVTK